jgi:fumarate reductase flavoprotein subunit
MHVVETDLAIIGGGGAGLRAAIAAAEADPGLALVSKVVPMRSHTVAAEGGSAGRDPRRRRFAGPTISTTPSPAATGSATRTPCEYFVEHCTEEMVQLEHWGCPWSRKDDGNINVRFFGGMKVQRTWFAADKSGFHMLHTLFQTSLQAPGIQPLRRVLRRRPAGRGRPVRRASLAIEIATGEFVRFRQAVILATGGAGRVYRQNTNAGIVTGDGMGMAYRHGVRCATWSSCSTTRRRCPAAAS